MSFDLVIWYSTESITSKEAFQIYEQLCDGNLSTTTPHQNIQIFLTELTHQYPEIDCYPDEKRGRCPWSTTFDKSNNHLIIPILYSFIDDLIPFIIDLASKYSLVCFSPQNNLILHL